MSSIFLTERTRAVRIEDDLERWSQALHDVYVSNHAFLDLTNHPSSDYKDMILRELKEARETGRLSLAIQHQESKQWIGILEFWGEVPSDKKPWIGLFMIHKLYQHTGLGREVIQQFFRFALSQGYHELRIGVDMENQSGQRFWESLGFLEYTKKEVSYPTGVRCVRCMEVRF